MPRKKFIEKKNSVTYHLVHRSQQDPEQSERVLLPDAATAKRADIINELKKKHGIYYEDDYDYMKHLKDRNAFCESNIPEFEMNDKTEPVRLPSELFESNDVMDPGFLNAQYNTKGPRPDWDPDIVAALDEDFDFDDPDNQLADDFMIEANDGNEPIAVQGEQSGRYYDSDSENGSDSDDSCKNFRCDDDSDINFSDEETKSRFTEYSMTSSVLRRNKGLTMVDDRFETLYEQYDDEEIGALDHDEIEGSNRNTEQMLIDIALKEYDKACVVTLVPKLAGNRSTQNLVYLQISQKNRVYSQRSTAEYSVKKLIDVVQATQNIGRMNLDDLVDSDPEDLSDLIKISMEPEKDKWDCESILSTYSTLYNNPSVISEKIKREPNERPPKSKDNPPNILSHTGCIDLDTFRPRDESKEEKKLRKSAIKEYRKIRRTEKKQNKNTFKKEELKMIREQNLIKKNQTIQMS